MFHSYRPSFTQKKAFMPVALMPESDPRLAPLEAIAQQVLGREADDFHHTVTSLARKLWNELRDIWLLTDHEGGEQGFFTSTLYIRRDLRSPLEAAGLIEFQAIPDSRIEHRIRITPAGSTLLGEPHPVIVQEDTMLATVQITPGCVPGIDYPPVEQEIEPLIIGDEAHIYIPCANCGDIFLDRWPVWLWREYGTQWLYRQAISTPGPRLCNHCASPGFFPNWLKLEIRAREESPADHLWLNESKENVKSFDISDGDTQPLDLPAPPPKFDATRFFRLLDEQLSDAFMTIEQDRLVIARGHRDAIETIKRYTVHQQEQTGFLEFQVDQMRQLLEKQRDIAGWWRTQAERYQSLADRHADTIMKLAGEGAPAPSAQPGIALSEPRLSLVDVEVIDDLTKKHTGGVLAGLLDALHLPEPDEFRTSYPVLHEAKAAIGKRIVDWGYSVMAYHVETFRKRGGGLYLALDFGFGTVNIFDRDIKQHFVKYPGGYDHWLTEGFEQELDPPVQLMMSRDSRNYARLDDLVVIS